MNTNATVVFCKTQKEINEAVQNWVNEKGYKRVHTSSVDRHALHCIKSDNGYTRSECTPLNEFKFVIIFEQ